MAYKYTKLSDVELTNVADNSTNLLVEREGTIQKLNVKDLTPANVQPDWDETNEDSPAFILNKPDLSQVGGGGAKITYFVLSGNVIKREDGSNAPTQEVFDAFTSGIVLLKNPYNDSAANMIIASQGGGSGGSFWWVYPNGSSLQTWQSDGYLN